MKNTLNLLSNLLLYLSKVSNGTSILTDKNGECILAFNSKGEELSNLVGVSYDLAKKAVAMQETVNSITVSENEVETWCTPIEDFVICSNNVELIKYNESLKESLINALPFIARIAGGEAVVFGKDGTRIATVDSSGETDESFIGEISKDAAKAMKKQKPIAGESNYINGASAVRIPMTKNFGFGFNNEEDVLKSQKLIGEINKHKTARYNFSDIIGESGPMIRAKEMAKLAANSVSNVLIYGDTGTGKELFAQSIHNASKRSNKPFVAVNCAAIPLSLMESNFFGYEKGSFTGAKREGSKGVFEQANGGTIFLDEISEMNLELQPKILRVLQEKKLTRIGGSKEIDLNVRFIFASNRKLEEMIKNGDFRKDLYYRINVVDVTLPSLNEIREDIPLIIKNAIKEMNRMFGLFIEGIDDNALNAMIRYHWPGNIRELMNAIEKAFNVIGSERTIKIKHLPRKIIGDINSNDNIDTTLDASLKTHEKQIIIDALNINSGKKVDTAEYLGISTTTLWRKINQYNIENEL